MKMTSMHRLIWLGLLLLPRLVSSNGLVTDGSVGAAKTLTGDYVLIPQSLGTTTGRNLFHSFTDFSIKPGQTVEFTGSAALKNVITRVTGLERSMINGKLASSIPNADFYLINPNGIIFGEHAVLDVPGAFHATTADQLTFNDGKAFNANVNTTSQLSSAMPSAFGFLGTSEVNNGLIALEGARLRVANGKTLALVAGNIHIHNLPTQESWLVAPEGELQLIAKQGKAEFNLTDGLGTTLPTQDNAGDIIIDGRSGADYADLYTAGNGAGRMSLWADSINLFNTRLINSNNGDTPALPDLTGVDVTAREFNLFDSVIAAYANAKGDAARINLLAQQLNLLDSSIISTAKSSGHTSRIDIDAERLSINSRHFDTGIFSDVGFNASGNSRSITIKAKELQVTGGLISSETLGSGAAGTIDIDAEQVYVNHGGQIATSTYSSGDAGSININTDGLYIEKGSRALTGIFSDAIKGTGDAGLVNINAKQLKIASGGQISSLTESKGDAGRVQITADYLEIDGSAAKQDFTGIFSAVLPGSPGRGGVVDIKGREAMIANGGSISSSTWGKGNAGRVKVAFDNLTIKGDDWRSNTGIQSSGLWGSSGNAGLVRVLAKHLNIVSGGSIFTNAIGSGGAGTIKIEADTLLIDGQGQEFTGVLAFKGPSAQGASGHVEIIVDNWMRLNQGVINLASTANDSTTSSVNISTPTLELINSKITTDTLFGDGGHIHVDTTNLLRLQNSLLLTTVLNQDGNGGNILVNTHNFVMENSALQANAQSGHGGNINVNASALIPNGNSLLIGGSSVLWSPSIFGFNVIQAASKTGVNGHINVTTPQLNLSGVLANLGSPDFETETLNNDFCDTQQASSLTALGSGGLKRETVNHGF